jgi:uncharacterized membrane protein YqjE
MATDRDEQGRGGEPTLATASTGELVGRLAEEGKELVKKEVELAKAELRTEWKDEIRMALGLLVGGVGAFLTLELLLAALVLALAESMSGGAAALVAAGVAFVIGAVTAFAGWKMRAKTLLGKTRKTLKEDVQWAKQQLS